MKKLLLVLLASGVSWIAQGEILQDPWMPLLEQLVNTQSGTSQQDGLSAMRKLLQEAFASLGMRATVHNGTNEWQVLSFEVEGAHPEIILLGHIDTVFTEASPAPNFRIDGDKIFGGGIIDMKGGIVMILQLLSDLKEKPGALSRIRVVLNDDEEIGSSSTKTLLGQLAEGSKAILVFEPGLPSGDVVTSQSGVRWLNLTVHGKSAHAGLEHHLGYNACVELSHKLVAIAKLTDYSRLLTVNPGTVKGGTKPNVVCEEATAGIDIRYVDIQDLDHTLEQIQKINDTFYTKSNVMGFQPRSDFQIIAQLPSMPASSTARLFQMVQNAAKQVDQNINGIHVGYASDANHLASLGIDIIVGLGPYGGGMHTQDEYMSSTGYHNRLQLNRRLIENLLSETK